MRTSSIICFIAALVFLIGEINAQDKLLMTNGKYRDIKGKVVATEYDVVIWQTEVQAKREAEFLLKSGKTREEFNLEENERISTAKEKLAQKRKEMESQILSKMEELSPEDFEKWKNEQLLKLSESEAAIGSGNSKRKKRRFTKSVSRELVFSIIAADSSETIVYSADTLGFLEDGEAEVEWGVEDMRKYIAGRQDGRRHKTAMDAMLGAGVGTVGAILGAFWGPTLPAAYIAISTIANTKIQVKAANVDKALITEPAYMDGYERSAKRKKTGDFIKGSVAGLAFGFLMYQGIFR